MSKQLTLAAALSVLVTALVAVTGTPALLA